MKLTCRCTGAWPRPMVILLLLLSFSSLRTAMASDGAMEREQLGALARQIELADSIAAHAANTAMDERARYHFDYARLHADLERVRAGVQDYLAPERAQPRDPVPIAGDFVRSHEPQESSP